ncbi:MAG: tetratricopeptide repeat protein [Myxococcota bacterium]
MQRVPEPLVRGLPIAAGFGVLAMTLGHDFAFDDPMAVVGNPLIDGSRSWFAAFTSDFWGERPGFEHIASWRPLTLWSLRLDGIMGGGEPSLFHLTNSLVHLLVIATVGLLGRQLGWQSWARLWLGLSVAVTPAFAEGVASVVGRGDLLAALFGLWGVVWIRGRPCLALLSLTLALLSKETAAVYAVTAGAWALQGRHVGRLAAISALGGGWYLVRSTVVGHLGGVVPAIDNPLASMEFGARALAGLGVVGRYISWSVGGQPVPADLAAGVTHGAYLALGALALLVLVAALVWAWQVGSSALLGLVLALTSLALLSNIAFILPTPAAGRLAYHPGLGVALALAAVLSALPRPSTAWRGAHALAGGLLCIGVFSGLQTVAAWEDDAALFEASVAIEPDSARARCNLAKAQMEAGDSESAQQHLEAALERAPDYPLALLNLSAALERTRPGGDEAWRLAQRAVAVSPRPGKADANLCALALNREAADAVLLCERGVELMPRGPQVMTNLARAYGRAGRSEDAESAYSAAVTAHPNHAFVLGHWVGHLVATGRTAAAVEAQRRVLSLGAVDASARRNLVALLLKLATERGAAGQGDKACELGREAAGLVPGVAVVAARAQSLCAGR